MSQTRRKSCHMAIAGQLEHKAWLLLSSYATSDFAEYEFMYTDTLNQLYDEDDTGNTLVVLPVKEHKRIAADIKEAQNPSET